MLVMALVLILARSEDWGSGPCRVVKGNSFELGLFVLRYM
jgi:hypothetical protein